MTEQEQKVIDAHLFALEAGVHFEWYYENGHITQRDGNVCMRLGDDYVVTASGVRKDCLTVMDFLLVNEQGKTTAEGRIPSIETLGHIAALKASGKKVSVHVHSPNSTAFYSMREPLVYEWPELTRYTKVGETIPYLTPGSKALHEAIDRVFSTDKCDIVVLKNHGLLVVGDYLDECKEHIQRLEHTTDMWLKMLAAEGNGSGR